MPGHPAKVPPVIYHMYQLVTVSSTNLDGQPWIVHKMRDELGVCHQYLWLLVRAMPGDIVRQGC